MTWGIVVSEDNRTAEQVKDLKEKVLLTPKVLPGKGGGIPILHDSLDNFARNWKHPFTVNPHNYGAFIRV